MLATFYSLSTVGYRVASVIVFIVYLFLNEPPRYH